MTGRSRAHAVAALRASAAMALLPMVVTPAVAQVRTAADVTLAVTGASGASLSDQSGKGNVSGLIQVDPSLYYRDGDVTTAVVRGSATVEQYASDYGTAVSGAVNANVQHRVSDLTVLGLNASFSSRRSAIREFLRQHTAPADLLQGIDADLLQAQGPQAGVSAGLPEVLEPSSFDPSQPDFLEAGLGGRTTDFRLGGSVDQQLSARDSLSFEGSVRWHRASDFGARNFRSEEFSGFYRRRLSPRTTISAGSAAGWVNYEDDSNNSGNGNGRSGSYLTPTLALSVKLSEVTTANAAVGATIARVEGPSGATVTHTGLAGRLELCRLQYRATLCANVSRNVQPTSFAGLSTVTSAGLSYGRALDIDQQISFAATYTSRNSDFLPDNSALAARERLFIASARYSRSFGERLEAFVAPGYAKIWGGLAGSHSNYQLSAGIRYRLGKLK